MVYRFIFAFQWYHTCLSTITYDFYKLYAKNACQNIFGACSFFAQIIPQDILITILQINLPTGERVRATRYLTYMNIFVEAAAQKEGQRQVPCFFTGLRCGGICGDINDRQNDDFTHGGRGQATRTTEEFVQSWEWVQKMSCPLRKCLHPMSSLNIGELDRAIYSFV